MNISPFNSLHTNLNANFGHYGNWQLPADYGDLAAESAALYQASAAFDLSAFGKFAISGDDASVLVHNLLASSVASLEDGKWIWGFICDPCGSLADFVRIAQTGQSYLLMTPPASRLKIYEIAKDCAAQYECKGVKIVDQTEKTGMLGVYGPKSVDSIDNVVPFGIAEMEPNSVKVLSLFMMQVTVIRGSWLGLDGIEILSGTGACKIAGGAVEKYHKQEHITPAGMECLEIALTEASLPILLNGQQLPETLSPVSYGLASKLDSTKQFFGKNGATSCKSSRVLIGISSECKAHTHKDLKVQYDGREIGWTDRVVWSDRLGRTICLAVIDSALSDLSDEVQITGDGLTFGGEIVKLPFDNNITSGLYLK